MALSFDDLVPENQAVPQGGTSVDFSDLIPTAPQQISGAVRPAAILGSGAAKGAANFAGTAGDAVNALNSWVVDPTMRAMSTLGSTIGPSWGTAQPLNFGAPPDPQDQNPFPTSRDLVTPLQNSGVVDRSDLKPQTTTEKYLDKIGEGLGGTVIPSVLSGGVVPAAKMLMQGAASGAGDQLMAQWFPNSNAAQAAGAIGGAMAGGGISNLGEKAVNVATGNNSPLIQAYQTAGITPRMVGDVSGSPTMKVLQNIGGNKGTQQTLDEFGQSVNDLADSVGTSHTLQEAGQAVQASGNQWLDNAKAQGQQAWGQVDQQIGSATPVNTNNTQQVLAAIKAKAGNNSDARDFLTSGLAKSVNNIVTNSPTNDFSFLTGTRNIGYDPTQWQTLAAVRSRVGEYLADPQAIADAGRSQAKMLYAGITQDMQNAAFAKGQPALQAFQNANAVTSQTHDFVDNVLGPVLKQNPEDAAKYLISSGVGGGTTLTALRQQMPGAADELASVSLRRNMAGQSTGDGNAVSPSRWLSNSDPTRRLSPEAFSALYPDPDVQNKISALNTVADNMRSTEKLANHSNTAGHLAAMSAIPAALEGGYRGYEMGGVPGAVFGSLAAGASPFAIKPLAGALTNNAGISRFMSSPVSQGVRGQSLIPYLSSQAPFSLALPAPNGGS